MVFAALALHAVPSAADAWASPAPGVRGSYAYTAADGIGESVSVRACLNMRVSFEPGTSGEAWLYGTNEPGESVSQGLLLAAFSTSVTHTVRSTRPYMRVYRKGLPSTTARLSFICSNGLDGHRGVTVHGSPIGIAVWGQSNAVAPSTDPTQSFTTSPSAVGLHSRTLWMAHTLFRPLDDSTPVHSGVEAGQFSPWPVFAGRVMDRLGRPVYMYAGAQGGSCLLEDVGAGPLWDPDQPGATGSQPGSLYNLGVQGAERLPNLVAVLWDQGECDSLVDNPTTYEAALEHLADRVFEDLGVPMIMAPIQDGSVCGASFPTLTRNREATQRAINDHALIFQGPELNDVRLEDCPSNIHLSDMEAVGQRWADALFSFMGLQ
jgi:hypothetical protein